MPGGVVVLMFGVLLEVLVAPVVVDLDSPGEFPPEPGLCLLPVLAPTSRPFSNLKLTLPEASTPSGPRAMLTLLPPMLTFPAPGASPDIPEMAEVACATICEIASASPGGTPPPTLFPSAWICMVASAGTPTMLIWIPPDPKPGVALLELEMVIRAPDAVLVAAAPGAAVVVVELLAAGVSLPDCVGTLGVTGSDSAAGGSLPSRRSRTLLAWRIMSWARVRRTAGLDWPMGPAGGAMKAAMPPPGRSGPACTWK